MLSSRDRAALLLAVAASGLLVLAVAARFNLLRLSWSDEIVYAVMGRNLAEGRGAISNFYDARSLAAKGYPLGDVHMPGHPFLLALAFRAFGPRETAAFLPAALAFVASGALLWLALERGVSRRAGWLAAAVLYGFPSLAGYATSAMAETPLVCLAAVHLLLWLRALERPTASRFAGLALVLGIGATVRESFLALLVPTLLALVTAPRPVRRRGALLFAAVLSGYMVFVWWPLARMRAPFPNHLRELLQDAPAGEAALALLQNARDNLRSLVVTAADPEEWTTRLVLALGILLPLVLLGRGRLPRLIALYGLGATAATLLPLLPTYKVGGWTGLRVLLVLAPAAAATLATALDGVARPALRRALVAVALSGLIALSWAVDLRLARDRSAEHAEQEETALALVQAFDCRGPQLVVADEAFLYGWLAFPATVVWKGALDEGRLAAVAARVVGRPTGAAHRASDAGSGATAYGCSSRSR